jgi:hypothetical protein
MEEIKTLLKSLEKEGLYEGKVLFEETEYLFLDGLVSVNPAIDMKGLSQDEKEERLKRMREKHTWQEACVVDTIEAYEKYLDMHPDSEYAGPARDRVNFLKKDLNVWQQTQEVDSVPAYEFYLRDYPEGQYIDAARDRRQFLKEADAAWQSAQNSNTIKEYKLFIDQYPDCNLTHSARNSIKALEDESKAWAEAEKKNTIDAYNAYLKNYPAGVSRDKATKKIEILEEEERKAEQRLHEERNAWKEAEAADTIESYQSYLDKYEDGQFVAAAVERIKCLEKDNTAWQLACQKNTMGSYNRYLRKYPGGKHIEIALKNLEILRKDEQQTKLSRKEEIPVEKEFKERRFFKVAVVASIFIIAAVIVIVSNNGKKSNQVPDANISIKHVEEKPVNTGKEPAKKEPEKPISTEKEEKNEEKVIGVKDNEKIKSDGDTSAVAVTSEKRINTEKNKRGEIKGKEEDRSIQIYTEKNMKETKDNSNRETPKPKEVKATPILEKEISSVKFTELPAGFREIYEEKLKFITIPGLESEVKVSGNVLIILKVDDKGKISIQGSYNSYLKVTPDRLNSVIKERIYKTIGSIELPPPMNTNLEPLVVEDWKVFYQIGTYNQNIILNRVTKK